VSRAIDPCGFTSSNGGGNARNVQRRRS